MIMNDKTIFDRYYCINSAQTKEIMVHYILQPHHIFIRVKVFILMLFRADFSYSLLARPVTSINKNHVLTRARELLC